MHRLVLIVFALLLVICAPCYSTEFTGIAISGILFDPPLTSHVESLLDQVLKVRTGTALESTALRESIQALFEIGRFADIRVDAVRVPEGVQLTFQTKPSWFIGDVRVEGVPRPPSDGLLVNTTRLRLGELFTQEKLDLATRSLRTLLKESGFQEPQIKSQLRHDNDTQQVHISFLVLPGERARIGALLVTGNNALLNEQQIRTIAKWPRGAEYKRDRIQQGIEGLRKFLQKQDYWQTELQVHTAEYRPAGNELTLVVRIDPGPLMHVRVEGTKLSLRRLKQILPIYSRGTYDEELLQTGSLNMRHELQNNGFFNAEVTYEVEEESDTQISIVYRVQKGTHMNLSFVELHGNQFFDNYTIRERMQLKPSGMLFRRGRFSQLQLEQDLQAIRSLYLSNGFRDVKVTGEMIQNYQNHPNGTGVRIAIEEGFPTFISGLFTNGLEDFPVDVGQFEFAAAPNQPFSESNVASDRDRVLSTYHDAGYQDVAFDWRVEEGSNPTQVALFYDVTHGAPLLMGPPILTGSQKTQQQVLDRRIELYAGSPLSQSRIFTTQRNLYDLGVFSKVNVAIQNPEGEERIKNVLLQVEEARRWAVGVGGGAEFARIGRNTAELTNPAGDAAFSPRVTLEMTRLNVNGKAHTMGFRTRLSLLQQRGLFTYQAPRWFDSDRWSMTISGLYDTFRNVNTFTGRRFEGAFQLTQQLDRSTTVLYRYAYRRTSIDEETLNIEPLLVPLISQPTRVGLLSSTYILDRRDDPTDTSKGMYSTLDVGLASKLWGGQPNFLRLLAQNSTYHKLLPRVIFARTVQLGITTPWTDTNLEGVKPTGFAVRPDPRIPISERYFGGGANSHRGFPFNQAGPRDPSTGFPIGGGAQFLNSLELRFPVIGTDFSTVLFHDAGNVYSRPGRISFRSTQRIRTHSDNSKEFEYDYMVHAVGVGIRYRTPIGPIRFDIAYSLNPPRFIGFDGTRDQLLSRTGTFREQKINGLQFHFSLGQTF